jgi:UDP-N-acetylglucosamine 1-carboxyvinyltransferase
MGADISVRNRLVEIEGGRKLTGCRHTVMSGWDEALTFILAAGVTGGEICVKNFSTEHISGDAAYLRKAGLDIFEWGGNVYATAKNKELKAFDLFTAPYPGVNSDMQPLFAVFASRCRGESTITDQRFTERFQYVKELQKFGMPIKSYGNCAVVQGPAELKGASVTALDLRCGSALILTALAAKGTTIIDNCYQIERGHENVVERFRNLGADIVKQND